jgi:hypothetical protein
MTVVTVYGVRAFHGCDDHANNCLCQLSQGHCQK